MKVGCCGLSFFPAKKIIGDYWKKEFKNHVQCYASKFDVLEINKTFYSLPKKSTTERWFNDALEVNERFEFTLKAPREITHKLKFGRGSLDCFSRFINIVYALHSKIILFQTPKSFKFNNENKRNMSLFFSKLREEFDLKDIFLVWEPRGETLKNPLLLDFLRANKLNECVDPLRNKKSYGNITYFRLHGFGKKMMYNYKFSDEELKKVLESVNDKAYVMFNNFYKCEDAIRFRLLSTGQAGKKQV